MNLPRRVEHTYRNGHAATVTHGLRGETRIFLRKTSCSDLESLTGGVI